MNMSMQEQMENLREKIVTVAPLQGTQDQQERPTRSQPPHPRKRMGESSFGSLGDPETVTVQFGTNKASMRMDEGDRKRMAESIIKQHSASNASTWADVASRFGTAALSTVAAIAMGWALVRGVKSGTKGD